MINSNYYDYILHFRLCDYLLLTHNLDNIDELKKIICSKDFIDSFLVFIKNINSSTFKYPEIIKKNGFKLVNYIETNSDYKLSNIRNELSSMNSFSHDKYLMEYYTKQTSIIAESLGNYMMWNVNEIEESLYYDFLFTLALSSDENTFLVTYLPGFIMSKNAIYSINKTIRENPKFLDNKEFERRIRTIIEANLEILKDKDEEVMKTYISKNYNITSGEVTFDPNELIIFEEMNNNALNKINNKQLSACNLYELETYYNLLTIEHYLVQDDKIDISCIDIKTIYSYINELETIDDVGKRKLQSLLNYKKEQLKLKKNDLEEYNSYLVKLNNIETSKIVNRFIEFYKRSDLRMFLKALYGITRGSDEYYKRVLNTTKNDLFNFELLIMNEYLYQKNVMYTNSTNFPLSLRKFITEYPNMFLNETILNRTLSIMKKYSDSRYSKKLIKKLEAIKKA